MSRPPTPAPSVVPFNKPWKSCADQLVILEGRGLVIADKTNLGSLPISGGSILGCQVTATPNLITLSPWNQD